MGLIVSASYMNNQSNEESFYSRIELYQVTKDNPHLQIKMRYFLNKDYADMASEEWAGQKTKNYSGFVDPLIWDDDYVYNPIVSGSIDTETFITGGYVQLSTWYAFPLTSSKEFTTSYISESISTQIVQYIDFDEDGNEITGSREEIIVTETPVTESVSIDRAYDMTQITGSLFEFGYQKMKEKFQLIFGSQSVFDL